MNKGDKIIYTDHFPGIGYGVGYYLFRATNEILHKHLIAIKHDLVNQISDYEAFLVMQKNQTLRLDEVTFVRDTNIIPFTEKTAGALSKKYKFVKARQKNIELFFPQSWELFESLEKFTLSFARLVFLYYAAKSRFIFLRIFNKIIYPVLGILLFDFITIFQLHSEYRQAADNLKQEKRSIKKRNPLILLSIEDKEKDLLVVQEASQRVEACRENVLKSSRAVLGMVLAVITVMVSGYFFKRSEIEYNKRINIILQENQKVKDDASLLKQRYEELTNENRELLRQIKALKGNKKGLTRN